MIKNNVLCLLYVHMQHYASQTSHHIHVDLPGCLRMWMKRYLGPDSQPIATFVLSGCYELLWVCVRGLDEARDK